MDPKTQPTENESPKNETKKQGVLIGVLAGALLAAIFLFSAEDEKEPRPDAAPTSSGSAEAIPTPRIRPSVEAYVELQRRLERQLTALDATRLEPSWLAVRALGRRAHPSAQKTLNAALLGLGSGDAATEQAPAWAGTEPQLALMATLLETGTAAGPLPLEALRSVLQRDASDATTLAWRVELSALLLRAEAGTSDEDRQRLAKVIESGVKWLERQSKPGDGEFAHLAQAVFRAAPFVLDQRLQEQVRRIYGKLSSAAIDGLGPQTLALRLEAMASFARLSHAQTNALDPRIANSIRSLQSTLAAHPWWRVEPHATTSEPSLDDALTAALTIRALRLCRAALSPTAGAATTVTAAIPGASAEPSAASKPLPASAEPDNP